MPRVKANDTELYYQEAGTGPKPLEANEFDPLKEFSAARRMELLAMSSIM